MNRFALAFAFAATAIAAPMASAVAAPTPWETTLKDLRAAGFFAPAIKILGR